MPVKQSDLHELLSYDIDSGDFRWKKQRRGVQVGKSLGTDNGFGYLSITVLGTRYYLHRLAWMYVYGVWPETIDHINCDKGDNRIKNLRSCSQIENNQNRRTAPKNSKTSLLGVSWHKKAQKWQAHICIYKQRKYLGLFTSVDAAHAAYMKEKASVRPQETQ
jgi:hypothetical protein